VTGKSLQNVRNSLANKFAMSDRSRFKNFSRTEKNDIVQQEKFSSNKSADTTLRPHSYKKIKK